MRVIAGHWKGRRLQALPGQAVRPTTDRVKEAMFSVLGPRIHDALIADLCCGAGGLGIEALSRGARRVSFVDLSRESLQQTAANLERCGCDETRYQLRKTDAVAWVRRAAGERWQHPLFVLADPPYHTDVAQRLLTEVFALPPDVPLVVFVLEHGPTTTLAIPEAQRRRCDQRVYGQSRLLFFRGPAGGDHE